MNSQEKGKFIQRIKDTAASIIAEVGGIPHILMVHKRGVASAVILDVQNDNEVLEEVAKWRSTHDAVAHVASGIVTDCSEDFEGEFPESGGDMLNMDETVECVIVFAFFEGKIMSMYSQVVEAGDGTRSIGEWRNETWVETDEITFDLENVKLLE